MVPLLKPIVNRPLGRGQVRSSNDTVEDLVGLCGFISFIWQTDIDSSQENELWDKESNHSIGSWVPPTKTKHDGYAESMTASLYGRETYYDPGARSYSPAPSQIFAPPPGYQSGRNTPQMYMPQAQSPLAMGGNMGYNNYSQAGSRPVTNYLDMPIGGSPDGGPSDADLERALSQILQSADLNTVTKKDLRRQLEEHFGCDLSARKSTVNGMVDRLLSL